MNQYKSGLNLHRVQPTLIVRQRDSFEKLTRTTNFSTRCFFSHTVFCLTQFFVSHGPRRTYNDFFTKRWKNFVFGPNWRRTCEGGQRIAQNH